MHSPKRIKITDVNPHLICVLCGGYYIDATTIIECLHSFCKSCIVRYLQKNKYCPICDVQVHKTSPLLNIRSDRTLQNIVYKLVPSLFKSEMERRVAFYEKYPGATPPLPEQRGEITDTTPIFFPDELLIICLEYQSEKNNLQGEPLWPKRYLHCPAAVTVSHLVKLIRGKFSLSHIHHVSLYFKDDLLQDDITIMDIAYTYQCRRKIPIHLMYRILELKKKTIRLMPPIPPNKNLDSSAQSEVIQEKKEEELKRKLNVDLLVKELPAKNEIIREQNNVETIQGKQSVNSIQSEKETSQKEQIVSKSDVKEAVSSVNLKELDNSVPINNPVKEVVELNEKEENKQDSKKSEKKGDLNNDKDCNMEDSKDNKKKQDQTSSAGSSTEGEWKEVQLQISENGVMSVRNMKSSECSPIPAVEAPNCPVSHPVATSQANSIVMTNKMTFATVPQNRNTEPIVSVSKVSKDQVKKEVNHTMIPYENKLSISRVTPPSTAAKGDVLNRIVSKLSPNETIIGNTGVTIRPVTKVYPGMKSVQDRKSRGTTNHLQSRYKTISSPTWNPSIDRATMLTLKQNCDLNKPPRFFKMRSTPRFLGNPAEGVKPLYGSGGRQEDSSSKQSPPKSPVKQPPPYTPRGQDKPPPPYTPRPAHTGCAGATNYLPPNPYHLLYSGFPFSAASPELLRSMCASAAYHPSLPPSISMLYNNPGLQQTPQRSQPPPVPPPSSPHDYKNAPSTPPSIQRIPSSLSPKPSLDDKKRELPPTSSSTPCPNSSMKLHKQLEDKPPPLPPLPPPPIPLPPPPPHTLTEKSPATLTNNNNTKESPLSTTTINQHTLK